MNPFNNEYYIAHASFDSSQFHLQPDQKAADRRYRYRKLNTDGPALVFSNAFKERDLQTGNQRKLTDTMSDGASFVVTKEIRDYLSTFDIESLQLYPAEIIDDNESRHNHYWYLNIYNRLDCWDRSTSEYELDEEDEEAEAIVDKFSLNAAILEAIPEEKRLIFKIGGSSSAYIFVHQKIVSHLLDSDYTGIQFFKVSEFTEGDQHNI
ncbi:imm11 family protein [Pleionea sp. CnH1-48]|uniref:imm11 family protein n=1 Tax=Pleionea sp. CnH1-48 TaxID=2954494 RepID=UPI002097373F|nr:DUF1629 domain-containing protein [Pleionea sp. CnH1-48]MCO7222802.1 hypothetical protein [Pleionea sp. CnH1-48]